MPKVIETKEINISEVVFHQRDYPREKPKTSTIEQYIDALKGGYEFPPIEVDVNKDNGKYPLLDGYHRLKAFEESGIEKILASFVELEGFPRLLYAAGRNAVHGDRLTKAEKRAIAEQMVEESRTVEEVAQWLQVSKSTVGEWTSHILKRRQRSRDAKIWWLHLLGWTTREIGEVVDVDSKTVSNICGNFPELEKFCKDQASRGQGAEQIAEAQDVSRQLVEAILLQGKTDEQRLETLKIGIQPYDVWNFTQCDPRFGCEYPGRIPGQLIAHVLYFYTNPGDLIVDPMVGSGTTIDVCAYLGRKCYGYDAHPRPDRYDIKEHDLILGWPERTKQAQLIFWDPPYFKKKDDGYGDKSISRLSREQYLSFFAEQIKALPEKFKGRIAFLCSAFNEESDASQNIFIWDYLTYFIGFGWQVERHIQTPLSTQAVHPDIVKKFRAARRLARLGRDLVILRRNA